jgi:eukaryotic-like serine/threonine-protein kinase
VRPHLVEDDRVRHELREEAEALERLAHPVIVRSFDAVVDGPRPHLLLEHLEGPTLRRLIRRHGPTPLEQLLPLAAHVAAALHYMAGELMVHLDVKPDNIVMGVPPRLIDMSIARSFERAAEVRGALGTDAYMPPEQCAPRDHPGAIGPASDVWGLGATLFHAIASEVPFPRPRGSSASDDPAVRFPQLHEDPRPLPPSTPEPLAALVERMLAKRPEERPSASEVVLALEPLVAKLPRKLVLGRHGARAR